MAHATHATHAPHAAHAAKTAKTSAKEVIMTTSEELVSHMLLLMFFRPSFAALFIHPWLLEAESTAHKVIVFIKERGEGISSTEELAEYLIGMTEGKVASAESLEPSFELRASCTTAVNHVLAAMVV